MAIGARKQVPFYPVKQKGPDYLYILYPIGAHFSTKCFAIYQLYQIVIKLGLAPDSIAQRAETAFSTGGRGDARFI